MEFLNKSFAFLATIPLMAFAAQNAAVSENIQSIIIPIDSTVDSASHDTWISAWHGTPKSICLPTDSRYSSCKCDGLRYGKTGNIILYRKHNNDTTDSIEIDQSSGISYWEQNFKNSKPDTSQLQKVILSTPLKFIEDSLSDIFPFLYAKKDCDHELWSAVGITKENRKLHVLADSHTGRTILLNGYSAWSEMVKYANSKYVSIECRMTNYKTQKIVNVLHTNGNILMTEINTSCPDTSIDIPINANLISDLFKLTYEGSHNNLKLAQCVVEEISNHYSNDSWKSLIASSENEIEDAVTKSILLCENNNPGIADTVSQDADTAASNSEVQDRLYIRNDSAIIEHDTMDYLPKYYAWGREIKEHLEEFNEFDEAEIFFAKRIGDLFMEKGRLVMTFEISKFTETSHSLAIVRLKTISGIQYKKILTEKVYDSSGNVSHDHSPQSPKWELVMHDSYLPDLFRYFNYPDHITPTKHKKSH